MPSTRPVSRYEPCLWHGILISPVSVPPELLGENISSSSSKLPNIGPSPFTGNSVTTSSVPFIHNHSYHSLITLEFRQTDKITLRILTPPRLRRYKIPLWYTDLSGHFIQDIQEEACYTRVKSPLIFSFTPFRSLKVAVSMTTNPTPSHRILRSTPTQSNRYLLTLFHEQRPINFIKQEVLTHEKFEIKSWPRGWLMKLPIPRSNTKNSANIYVVDSESSEA